MNKILRNAGVLTLLLTVCTVVSSANATDSPDRSASQILQFAADMTGVVLPDSASRGVSDSVSVIDFSDTITPYLGEYASGRRVWRVVMTDLRVIDKKDSVHDWPGRMEAFVDSASGNLLKVVWTQKEPDPEMDLEVSARVAEEGMRRGGEVYESYPTTPPATAFAAAANACPNSPPSAKQIIGQYVMWRDGERAAHKAWVLQFRGIPLLEPHYPPIPPDAPPNTTHMVPPPYQLNRIRCIVSATSGNCVMGTTTPTIPLKPEDEARLFPKKDSGH